MAHFIQINTEAGKHACDESDPDKNEKCIFHIATVGEFNEPVPFEAQLQNVAFDDAAMGVVPKGRFG